MKTFKGKAIYNPSGKAGEYSYWACNFYNGCSNGCAYCYCKKGVLKKTIGGDVPALKKCFKNENHALEIFEKELKRNLSELQKHGLFFSFTTDPMLPETTPLTGQAIRICSWNKVPVKILTKRGVGSALSFNAFCEVAGIEKSLIAFGFTLTGRDELEPNASTNSERIEAAQKLDNADFIVWFSIEPVVELESSLRMIKETRNIGKLYKVGLMSNKKYDVAMLQWFIHQVIMELKDSKIYFKDSLLAQAGINREDLPSNCVNRDYSMFNG